MKLNKILFLGAIGLLGACTPDNEFLEEQPKDLITVENGYSSGDQVLSTLLSAYNIIETSYFPMGFGESDNFLYKQAGTDIMDGKFTNVKYSNFIGTWSSTLTMVQNVWDNYYKIISYCNLALKQMEVVTWTDEAEKNRIAAECKFLRGFSYLRLAEYYGAVPLVQEFTETARFDYERTPRADVYSAAITDMEDGYKVLPESTIAIGEPGRVSKYAAALFLAEAYLARGVENGDNVEDFRMAATYAQDVIDHHPLMTSRFGVRAPGASGTRNGVNNALPEGSAVSDLYVSQNMTTSANTEAIWIAMSVPDYATYAANGSKGNRSITLNLSPSLQDMSLTSDGDAGKGWSENIGPEYNGETNPYIHGGTGWGQTPPTWYISVTAWDDAHNFGSAQDDRYEEGITVRTKYLVINTKHPMYGQYAGWDDLVKEVDDTGSMFVPIFYKETPMDAWDWDTQNSTYQFYWPIARASLYRNKYIARSGEAYLLLAEAQYRGGDPGSALSTLNTLRRRANANDADHIDIQVILDERARELFYEENRWGTLLRMKPEEWQPRLLDYGMYTAQPGDAVFPEVRRWAEYDESTIKFKNWPIPQTYIDLNTGVKWENNEGWN